MQRLGSTLVCAAGAIAAGCSAAAKEYPIGAPQEKNGMEIAAVYLQPIEMDPPGVMRSAQDSDLHLESDIKAAKDNKNGFAQGDWIPYLAGSSTAMRPGRASSCPWSRKTGRIMATTLR
jgi:periplasmic iron binding protein